MTEIHAVGWSECISLRDYAESIQNSELEIDDSASESEESIAGPKCDRRIRWVRVVDGNPEEFILRRI